MTPAPTALCECCFGWRKSLWRSRGRPTWPGPHCGWRAPGIDDRDEVGGAQCTRAEEQGRVLGVLPLHQCHHVLRTLQINLEVSAPLDPSFVFSHVGISFAFEAGLTRRDKLSLLKEKPAALLGKAGGLVRVGRTADGRLACSIARASASIWASILEEPRSQSSTNPPASLVGRCGGEGDRSW
jgi:hypothetical protein